MAERKTPEEEAEALRAVVREAHEAIKDMRGLLREMRAVKDEVEKVAHEVFEERIAEEVAAGLAKYGDAIGKAINDATDAVDRRFKTISDVLLGEDPATLRQGEPRMIDYASAIAEIRAEREGS